MNTIYSIIPVNKNIVLVL